MYLWVVLAIFISALAALSGSLRPDVKEKYFNTQAEVETTRLYTIHKAAAKYFSTHTKTEGEIPYADLVTGYLPFGFNSGTVSSILYCLNDEGTNIPTNCQMADPVNQNNKISDGTCCEKSGDSNYLITYAPIPAKWTDIRTGKPRGEILDAMRDKFGYVDGLGYSVDNTADTPYMGTIVDGKYEFQNLESDKGIISQSSRPYYSIPQYVIDNNEDFDNNGPCAGNGSYCLVYITRIQ